ncbi:tRNA (adenosine(37)-N6)-threonylcarbamoyltransferase complex ATPase subunit type 1 TsaE [candidate division WOR-3 bacterium]|uniref:tRNA threonylcarbamoyladenosine biosynthesis protein TsaE n=1 Tax=candidate division WOR-3 bacterium TaxID=2052148 RepID=A0A9D5K9S8_UNCW3|nr:tRNA (adenosine(37)-N6)-threonylcarbamoyltransferase complex ATPase subunit type 1 TsaE [candidate division WOR-3 bacterium]MBD3364892.1 tRNA (adenosine(37)-N6)-threonylcarbamoyltransferase complex ATPase subunit type 1 TsaE [candidate division WOR-3 bacterium]
MREFVTISESETRDLGRGWAEILEPADTLAIYGILGSGKTVLIQGIIQGLGVTDRVQSPSFVLIRTYAGRLPVRHVDLYRLQTDEVEGLYLEEIFDESGVMLVEWAERARYLPGLVSEVNIKYNKGEENQRRIKLEGPLAERLS